MQVIKTQIWADLEKETQRIKEFDISKLELSPTDNKVLDVFFKKFLDPAETFPEGDRHNTIEKNLAIYIVKNKLPIEQIKKAYESKKFNFASLKTQIDGVLAGTYKGDISVGELVNWCKKFRADLVPLFWEEPKKQIEMIKGTPRPKEELKILWDSELSNYEEKKSTWVIEPLIKERSVNVLGGKRSTGKSWLGGIMSYSISNGIDFLGKFKTTKGKVLYLDRESQFSELKVRGKLIKKGLGLQGNSDIAWLGESYIKLDNPADIQRLEAIIKENNITFLVADVYRRLISFDENDAKLVSELFVDLLKPLVERTGISILLIHHERKGESSGDEMDMLRGSSDLANYVDGIIQVERKGDTLTIKQTKSRGSKELEPFQLKVETDEVGYFRLTYKGAVETTTNYISKELVKWIQETHRVEFTYSEALRYCEGLGYKKTNINQTLNELQNKGIITKGQSKRSPYVVVRDLIGGLYG